MANYLGLSERKSDEMIHDLESDPMFSEMLKLQVIKRLKRGNQRIASDFLQFDDNLFHPESGNADISLILEKNRNIVPLIRELGSQKFRENFLDNDNPDETEISRRLGIKPGDVKDIFKLVNNVFIVSEFFHPSRISIPSVSYSKIARVEKDGEGFVCAYYSLNMLKGEYNIDDKKLKDLRKGLDKESKRRADELVASLKLINQKKMVMHNILTLLVDVQKEYFSTGKPHKLVVFSEKNVSERLSVSHSSVSRAIYAKSIVTPHGKEIPLRMLLPSKKNLIKYILRNESEGSGGLSDNDMRKILAEKYGVSASRRLVCQCRNEIE
jgi:hypothetical protein